jgi:hypothetical protein
MEPETALIKMFNNVWPHLGERERRLVAAGEARRIGRCGISMVSRACGLSRVTITKGMKELDEAPLEPGKTRRPGAGRPRVERVDPSLWSSLEEIIKSSPEDGPDPVLKWTSKSTRQIAIELTKGLHPISHEKVAQILRQKGFRLQGTRQAEDSHNTQSRQKQFQLLNQKLESFLAADLPIITVESHKKDSAWLCQDRDNGDCARGTEALAPDWPDQLTDGSYPAGIYDLSLARDCVNVETAYDNIAFTVDSILGWWEIEGRALYSKAGQLVIITEIQHPERLAQWQKECQKLANYTGLSIWLGRFPPGTTRWNRPNLRLFSFTSSQYLGQPSKDHETVVRLIGLREEVRTMALGLRLDHSRYQAPLNLREKNPSFEGTWNLTYEPEFGEDSQAQDRLAAAI